MSKQNSVQVQTCTLKVNIDCKGCARKVTKQLQKIKEVYYVKIDAEEQGKVIVAGNVDPAILIKKLKKSAGKHAVLWEDDVQKQKESSTNVQVDDKNNNSKGGKNEKSQNQKGQKCDDGQGHTVAHVPQNLKVSHQNKQHKSVTFKNLPDDEFDSSDHFHDHDSFDEKNGKTSNGGVVGWLKSFGKKNKKGEGVAYNGIIQDKKVHGNSKNDHDFDFHDDGDDMPSHHHGKNGGSKNSKSISNGDVMPSHHNGKNGGSKNRKSISNEDDMSSHHHSKNGGSKNCKSISNAELNGSHNITSARSVNGDMNPMVNINNGGGVYQQHQGVQMQHAPSYNIEQQQQQQYMEMMMMMNQWKQQQQQHQYEHMMMMNQQQQQANMYPQPAPFTMMQYDRQQPNNYYMPMPSHPRADPITHSFSDENTNACTIM